MLNLFDFFLSGLEIAINMQQNKSYRLLLFNLIADILKYN